VNHPSAEKRVRQTKKRTLQNKVKSSKTRSAVKELRTAISEKNKEKAVTLFPKVQGLLSKLAKSGVIKAKTASRVSSRLATQVNAI
jgi:small subunit ribosomal protein S20